jgi:hypothetical protein
MTGCTVWLSTTFGGNAKYGTRNKERDPSGRPGKDQQIYSSLKATDSSAVSSPCLTTKRIL